MGDYCDSKVVEQDVGRMFVAAGDMVAEAISAAAGPPVVEYSVVEYPSS